MKRLSRKEIERAIETDGEEASYSTYLKKHGEDKKTSYLDIDWGRESYKFVVKMEQGVITDIVNTKADREGKAFYISTGDDWEYFDMMRITLGEDHYGNFYNFSYPTYAHSLKEEFVGKELDYLKGYIMVCENRKLNINEREIDENAAKKAFLTRDKNIFIEQSILQGQEERNRRFEEKCKNKDELAEKAGGFEHCETEQERLERYQSHLYSKYAKKLGLDPYPKTINKLSDEEDVDQRLKKFKKTGNIDDVSNLLNVVKSFKSRM